MTILMGHGSRTSANVSPITARNASVREPQCGRRRSARLRRAALPAPPRCAVVSVVAAIKAPHMGRIVGQPGAE